jgi:hypothetical protein
MKRIVLPLAVVTAFALLSLNAPSAEAWVRRVVVVPGAYRTTYVQPVLPIVRPRVVVQTSALPVFTPYVANPLVGPVVLIPQQPNWGYVPAALPVGTWTYVGR